MTELPNIFSFTCYRAYLSACVTYYKTEKNISSRMLAKECGISSPNFLQQVVQEKRNLTPLIATRIAAAFKLNKIELSYFMAMLKLATVKTAQGRDNTLKIMKDLIRKSERVVVSDLQLRDHWANPLVLELMKTSAFTNDPAAIAMTLRHAITAEEAANAIEHLKQLGHIGKAVDFPVSNDVRRIDLQRSHLRYLQLAQHRLHDPLDEREFQGLTVAVKKDALPEIKRLMREFIVALNERFAQDEDADEVLRIQLSAVKLTK